MCFLESPVHLPSKQRQMEKEREKWTIQSVQHSFFSITLLTILILAIIDEKRLKDDDEAEMRTLLDSLPKIKTVKLDVAGCSHEVSVHSSEEVPELQVNTCL